VTKISLIIRSPNNLIKKCIQPSLQGVVQSFG
jgi:hypothetical protein